LVVLLDTLAGDTAPANQTWESLRTAALAAGVDVFLHAAEPHQLDRQSAGDDIHSHPESRVPFPDEILDKLERRPYRHWGINE
jgi:hypothetical protein